MEAHTQSARCHTKYKAKPQHINCLMVIFWILLNRYGIYVELDNVFPRILNINKEINIRPTL